MCHPLPEVSDTMTNRPAFSSPSIVSNNLVIKLFQNGTGGHLVHQASIEPGSQPVGFLLACFG